MNPPPDRSVCGGTGRWPVTIGKLDAANPFQIHDTAWVRAGSMIMIHKIGRSLSVEQSPIDHGSKRSAKPRYAGGESAESVSSPSNNPGHIFCVI